MWVGEKKPDRSNINNYDYYARQERLIAIREDISVTAIANYCMFDVPGYAADGVVITKAIFRCKDFTSGGKTVDASISFGDNAAHDNIVPNSAIDIDLVTGVFVVPVTKSKRAVLGTEVDYEINTASNATVEVLDLELWGYVV